MSDRITRDQMLMEMAISASKRSTCNRKQIGAIIARRGRPISEGYGGAPDGAPHCLDHGCILGPDGGCTRTQHAEANAIAFAAAEGIPIRGAALYTTISPCISCAKMIVGAGIAEVYYTEEYRVREGLMLLRDVDIVVSQCVFQPEFHVI